MTHILKKNSFHWTEAATSAFTTLKQAVTQLPILKLIDFSQPFTIECDANDKGVGAMLMQSGQSLAFLSKALKGQALLLSIYENELLALVTTTQK